MVEDWLNPDQAEASLGGGRGGQGETTAPSVQHKHAAVGNAAAPASGDLATSSCDCPGPSSGGAQQKISKVKNIWSLETKMFRHGSQLQTVDEQYLRTGPGSPGYTRASPRSPAQPGPSSPGQAGLGGGAARAGKRKSRDVDPKGSGSINTSKTTRCKRPKVVHST